MLAAEYMARGMAEPDARNAARRELGNVTSLQEQYREQSGVPFLENFWRDLKFAVRTLRRNPVFTLSCAATLALGLAAMTTVLCVVSAFLWKPLPYPSPERLVAIKQVDPRNEVWPFSEPAWLDLQRRAGSLQLIAAYTKAQLSLTGAGDAEMISAAAVTPSFFPLFGLAPISGRVFSGKSKEVVIGRVAAGVSAPQARAELAVIAASMAGQSPQSDGGWSLQLIPLSDELIGPRTSGMIWMIFGAVTFLWLLACANVAGLQLA